MSTDEQGHAEIDVILTALGVVDGPTFDALMEALRRDSNIELRAQGVHAAEHDAGKPSRDN